MHFYFLLGLHISIVSDFNHNRSISKKMSALSSSSRRFSTRSLPSSQTITLLAYLALDSSWLGRFHDIVTVFDVVVAIVPTDHVDRLHDIVKVRHSFGNSIPKNRERKWKTSVLLVYDKSYTNPEWSGSHAPTITGSTLEKSNLLVNQLEWLHVEVKLFLHVLGKISIVRKEDFGTLVDTKSSSREQQAAVKLAGVF